MAIFVSHNSALAFWRSSDAMPLEYRQNARPSNAFPRKGRRPRAADLDSPAAMRLMLNEPVHVVVFDNASRTKSNRFVCHFQGSNHVWGSFEKMEERLFVASPEAVFLQMAQRLSFVDLVELGCELCGSYAIDAADGALSDSDDVRGFTSREYAITAKRRVLQYLNRADGCKGVKPARRAIRYVQDGSASPSETMVLLALCLPRKEGGFGLPLPDMNKRVDISPEVSRVPFGSFRKGDYCWNKAGLILEFDSTAYHTGADKITKDSIRRSELAYEGMRVITLTASQFADFASLSALVKVLEKELGIRKRWHIEGLGAKQRQLHRELLKRWGS